MGPHLYHTQNTGPEVDKVGEGNLCQPMLINTGGKDIHVHLLNTWQMPPNLATCVVNSVAKVYSILGAMVTKMVAAWGTDNTTY